jgi:hypothetical protein
MGALVRSAFRFPRASSPSGVQVKRSVFLKRRYRGRPLSPRREMKRLRAARHPITLLSGTIIRGTLKAPKSQLVTPISTKLQRPDGCD